MEQQLGRRQKPSTQQIDTENSGEKFIFSTIVSKVFLLISLHCTVSEFLSGISQSPKGVGRRPLNNGLKSTDGIRASRRRIRDDFRPVPPLSLAKFEAKFLWLSSCCPAPRLETCPESLRVIPIYRPRGYYRRSFHLWWKTMVVDFVG